MSVLFGRWKGAKITTEHSMHVLRAYRVSLTSLRPNQVSCLTSGPPSFGMFFLYLQLTFEWINIFYWKIYMYCSHLLHIFPNYIVNIVVCICWIIADCVGAIHQLFGFTARILYGRPTHGGLSCRSYIFGWLKTIIPNVFSDNLGWSKAYQSMLILQLNCTR